jgi:hypothetical protein
MSHRWLFLLSFLLLLAAVRAFAEEPAKAPPPPDDTILLADLRTPLPGIFSYGSWKDKLATSKSGLAILGNKGAQGDGGMGHEFPALADLATVAFVEVALGTTPSNEVPSITIALNDADGTQFSARVTVEQLVPGMPVWLRAPKSAFKLNGIEPGSDSQMDWSKVTRWHLQGDWNTKKPMSLIFVALRARR